MRDLPTAEFTAHKDLPTYFIWQELHTACTQSSAPSDRVAFLAPFYLSEAVLSLRILDD
jgi:hypothetical protein